MTREEFAKKWGRQIVDGWEEDYSADLLADLDNLSLSPAEGAEEFICKDCKDPDDGHIPTWGELERGNLAYDLHGVERLITEFATLHAQKIAEKMVEEKCAKCKHRGLPNSIQEALNSGDGVYRP